MLAEDLAVFCCKQLRKAAGQPVSSVAIMRSFRRIYGDLCGRTKHSGLSLEEGPIREANASAAWLVGGRDCDRYDIALGDAAIGTVCQNLHRHGVACVDARWNLGVHLE
jgi:hypothetical protein